MTRPARPDTTPAPPAPDDGRDVPGGEDPDRRLRLLTDRPPGQPEPGPAGTPADTGRRVRLTPASTVRMRPVAWTWDGRIPSGALTVVPGREGIGKSLLLAWLAAQITRGTLPGRHLGQCRPVIYAATEDSWEHTIAPRLYAAGADLDMVFQVAVEHDGRTDALTLPVDCAGLAQEISRLQVALLAADPLLSLIHAGIDTHRDRDLRTALEPLAALADKTGCAVVGLAHFNKSASSDALNLITGSRAFSAVARAVLAVARDTDADDGSCVLSQAKNNLGRLDVPSLRYVIDPADIPTEEGPAQVGRLRFTGESARSVADILGDTTDSADREERHHVVEWLTDYLDAHGGHARFSDIVAAAKAEHISARTLQRVRVKAGVSFGRPGFGVPGSWYLDHTQSPKSASAPCGAIGATSRRPGADGADGATATRPPIFDYSPSPTLPGLDRRPEGCPHSPDIACIDCFNRGRTTTGGTTTR